MALANFQNLLDTSKPSEEGVAAALEGGDSPSAKNGTLGEVRAYPYADAIQKLLEKDQINAARHLLDFALAQRETSSGLHSLAKVLAPARVRRSSRTDVDRTAEYRWLSSEGKAYSGHWVAVEGDRLLAHAPSLKELRSILRELEGAHSPLFYRVD